MLQDHNPKNQDQLFKIVFERYGYFPELGYWCFLELEHRNFLELRDEPFLEFGTLTSEEFESSFLKKSESSNSV